MAYLWGMFNANHKNSTKMETVKKIAQGEVAQAIYQGVDSCATWKEVDAFLHSQRKQPNGERFQVTSHCGDALWYFGPDQMEEIREFVKRIAKSYENSKMIG